MHFKKLLLTASLLWLAVFLSAQTFNFANYSINDGLAASKVNAILQDKNGFIWFATTNGLSKFDSHTFKTINLNQGLSSNKVTALYELNDGRIICGHDNGTLSLLTTDKDIKTIAVDSLQSRIFSINKGAKNDEIWICTERNGAFLVSQTNLIDNIENKKYEHFNEQNRLARSVYQVFVDSKSNLYFVTDLGIKIVKNKEFEFFYPRGVDIPQFTSIGEDTDGNLWFGTFNQGVFKYNPSTYNLKQFNVANAKLKSNFVTLIHTTRKGNIAVGTWGGGLALISNDNVQIIDESNGLSENKVYSIAEDRENNLWIGTNQNGVSCYRGPAIKAFLLSKNDKNNQIGAIFQSKDGTTWIGSNTGIFTISKEQSSMSETSISLSDFEEQTEITSIIEDNQGYIWVATLGKGIVLINPKTRLKAFLSDYLESISNQSQLEQRYFTERYINSLFIDSKNRIWIGMISGLAMFDQKTKSIKTYTEKDGIPENNVIDLTEDDKGRIWIATGRKGLVFFDNGKIKSLPAEYGSVYPSISSITKDKSNQIWISTEGGGFYEFKNNKLINYSEKDGLPTSFFSEILIDNTKQIWLGSNKGLIKYNPETKQYILFDRFFRNIRIEVKPNAGHIDAKGNLWFGTINGVFQFDSNYNESNTIEAITQLYAVKLFEKDTILTGASLNFRQNYISFYYNSICFSEPEKVLYQYKLEGLNEDWQTPTKNNFVTFSNLNPGKYTFKLKGSNNSGLWNSTPLEFSFSISPPFYNTWWFYSITAVIVAVGIVVFIKLRERNLKMEKIRLESEVEKRTIEVVEKKNEIEKQRDELRITSQIINQNNIAIKDSIRYARRIQLATLPKLSDIQTAFPDSFLIYKPKDIVSGDFYSLAVKDDQNIMIIADCTGHGVPGAFMSMIGTNLLNQIINERNILTPGDILKELDFGIETSLKQNETDSHDGMDIALISMNKQTATFKFSGANRPLLIWKKEGGSINEFSNEEGIITIKPNKNPIGGFTKETESLFDTHEFQLSKGDRIFMFTDGYVDQFGGTNGKKLLTKRFKEVLLNSVELPIKKQGEYLENYLNDWKGYNEQVDDVLVFGLEVN